MEMFVSNPGACGGVFLRDNHRREPSRMPNGGADVGQKRGVDRGVLPGTGAAGLCPVRAAGEILGRPEDVGREIEGVHQALLYRHHLEIVTLKKWSLSELEDLREIHRVAAVLGGDPHDFTAVILVDREHNPPVLLRGEEAW